MIFCRYSFAFILAFYCAYPVLAQEQKFVIRQQTPEVQGGDAPIEAPSTPVKQAATAVRTIKNSPLKKTTARNGAAGRVASARIKSTSPSEFFILAAPERSGLVLHKPAGQASRAASARYILSSDELFEEAKDILTTTGLSRLNALIPAFRRLNGHPVEIVCHSDHMGFESYNQDLTNRLAQRIKSWIVAHGLAESAQITATGVGSNHPLAPENLPNGRDNAAGRARNRRVEIFIEPKSEEPDENEVVEKAKPGENTATNMDLPPEMQKGLVDMVPVTEEELAPHFVGTGNEKPSGRNIDQSEWGGGGTNFGNAYSPIGGTFAGYGNGPGEFNEDGKRVVKVTPEAEKQEQMRKERVEAQNEFGLWRDP